MSIVPASNLATSGAGFSSARAKVSHGFYPQLDGLRAFAVAMVLMLHMSDLALPAPLAYLFSVGWIGVDAFFVLSGFLITTILLTYSPRPKAFMVFVLRRTLRTWPLYFVTLAIAYLTLRNTQTGQHLNWIQHVFFLQNYSPQFVARSLVPTWSLCVEEHFYLVWPFFIFLIPRRALRYVIPLIFVSLPFWRHWGLQHDFNHKQIYTETQFHLDGLMAGSFVALVFPIRSISTKTTRLIACGFMIVGVATSLYGFRHGWNVSEGQNQVFGFTSISITFASFLLFLLVSESSIIGRAFSLRPVRYIGRISYGIYLLHDGVISLIGRLSHYRLPTLLAESWMLAIPLRIGAIICVAAISYRYFESPILRMKDRLKVPGGGSVARI